MSCDSTDQRRSQSYAVIKAELLERNAKTCICDCSIVKAKGEADKADVTLSTGSDEPAKRTPSRI